MTNEQMLTLIFTDHGISTLGWMFAAAMAIGFILDEDGKKVRTWLFVIGVYFVIQEIVRYDLLQKVSHSAPVVAETVNIVIWLTYSAGLATGWTLSYYSKKKGRQDYKTAKVNQINEYNGGANGEEDNSTMAQTEKDEKVQPQREGEAK